MTSLGVYRHCTRQALRTLFNVAHRLHATLGPSWVLVLETLNALDRVLLAPNTTTQVAVLLEHTMCSDHTSLHQYAWDGSAFQHDLVMHATT